MVYSRPAGDGEGEERGGMWSQALMEYPLCTHIAESAKVRREKSWLQAFLSKLDKHGEW